MIAAGIICIAASPVLALGGFLVWMNWEVLRRTESPICYRLLDPTDHPD